MKWTEENAAVAFVRSTDTKSPLFQPLSCRPVHLTTPNRLGVYDLQIFVTEFNQASLILAMKLRNIFHASSPFVGDSLSASGDGVSSFTSLLVSPRTTGQLQNQITVVSSFFTAKFISEYTQCLQTKQLCVK